MSLLDFVNNELEIIKSDIKNEQALKIQEKISQNILEIIEVFEKQEHSGYTATYVAETINKLLNSIPLTALTGDDNEWEKISEDTYQNKRCSFIFKNDKEAYNNNAKLFSEDGGNTYFTNKDSTIIIKFPYIVPNKPEKIILK